MNAIPIIFLVLSVLVAILGILLCHYTRSMTGSLKIWVNVCEALLGCVCVCGLFLSWQTRGSAVFSKQHQAMKWMSKKVYDSDRFNALQMEWTFQRIQSKVLGQYLAGKFAGKRCVVLREPLLKNLHGNPSFNPVFDGLMEGLDGKLEVVAVREVAYQNPDDLAKEQAKAQAKAGEQEAKRELPLMAESVRWVPADVCAVLDKVEDFDILISCVGLPEGFLEEDGSIGVAELADKRIALASGYSEACDAALRRGTVVAAAAYRKDATCDEKEVPAKLQEAFDKRYVLLTQENIMAE